MLDHVHASPIWDTGFCLEMQQVWCFFGARRDIRRDMVPVEKLKGTKRVPKRGLGASGRLRGRKTTIFWRPQNSSLDGKSSLLDVPKMGPVLKAFRKGSQEAKKWIPYRNGVENRRSPGVRNGPPKHHFSGPPKRQNLNFEGPRGGSKKSAVSKSLLGGSREPVTGISHLGPRMLRPPGYPGIYRCFT